MSNRNDSKHLLHTQNRFSSFILEFQIPGGDLPLGSCLLKHDSSLHKALHDESIKRLTILDTNVCFPFHYLFSSINSYSTHHRLQARNAGNGILWWKDNTEHLPCAWALPLAMYLHPLTNPLEHVHHCFDGNDDTIPDGFIQNLLLHFLGSISCSNTPGFSQLILAYINSSCQNLTRACLRHTG